MQRGVRSALAAWWPAILLATILLVPFVNTPFTIDDPIYLTEAQHVLVEPLHPQAVTIVWSTDLSLRASQILPGGIAVPYLLIPAAFAGSTEWAAHLTQLILLLAALFATALLALRMGLSIGQARVVALLTAACPAVLGIAATVMPDVPAMLFTTLGMERILAWRDQRKWSQAGLASIWLAVAALTRTHTILVLAPAAIFLLDGIKREQIRSSVATPARFLPLILVPVLAGVASLLTADPDFHARTILGALLLPYGPGLVVHNLCALLAHWLIVIPLTVPWLVLRLREVSTISVLIILIAGTAASLRLGWVTLADAATAIVLVHVLSQAIHRRDRDELALWLWLFIPVPVVLYLHLPSKYLLPCVPAALILVARALPKARRETVRWLLPATTAAGVILGVLILLGIRDLAQTQRRAVTDLIEPYLAEGRRVWFAGHWGFQWYAELAGATPVTQVEPLPRPGDIIVVSFIDLPIFAEHWAAPRKVLRRVSYASGGPGRVMDSEGRAGFFASPYGYLPWIPESGNASRFEIWEAE